MPKCEQFVGATTCEEPAPFGCDSCGLDFCSKHAVKHQEECELGGEVSPLVISTPIEVERADVRGGTACADPGET